MQSGRSDVQFEINHIIQHLAVFNNRMVIVLYEKAGYGMRVAEAAVPVKR